MAEEASDEAGARLALLSLPKVGPARISWLLGAGPAVEVVAQLRAGRLPPTLGRPPRGVTRELVEGWGRELRSLDPAAILDAQHNAGSTVIDAGHPHWPFADDPEPPALLFAQGSVELLGRRPKVAIIGTRRCTALGRQIAFDFGAELAAAGLTVVSGLATGIDGAAHAGTLAAHGSALAVVGTGLDVVYPAANRSLWRQVAERGLLLTEALAGTRPERWRFPARNRLIAGLATVLVVVESHSEGGSLLTVNEMADRGGLVMAVPGSVKSPASEGSNRLLADGCPPACSATDVLDALGWEPPAVDQAVDQANAPPSARPEADISPLGRLILAEVRAGACHVDHLVSTAKLPIPAVLAEINRLELLGSVELDGSTVMLTQEGSGPT